MPANARSSLTSPVKVRSFRRGQRSFVSLPAGFDLAVGGFVLNWFVTRVTWFGSPSLLPLCNPPSAPAVTTTAPPIWTSPRSAKTSRVRTDPSLEDEVACAVAPPGAQAHQHLMQRRSCAWAARGGVRAGCQVRKKLTIRDASTKEAPSWIPAATFLSSTMAFESLTFGSIMKSVISRKR
jgi:hypothetical protein